MIIFEDALNILLSQDCSVEAERVSLSGSCGRILAEDIFSDIDMPPFDKSAVDGFALNSSDIMSDQMSSLRVTLQVVETIAAGAIPRRSINHGQCSRIMTGAMVPAGADRVIMLEDTEPAGDDVIRITGENSSKNICYRGEDIKKGDRVLRKGIRISPAHVAVLAGTGAVKPLVARLPGLGIISTGDELVEPGVVPGPAMIRNSNGWQLEAQVRSVPARPAYYGIARDVGSVLHEKIGLAMADNHVVLLTGGVSMGDFDLVPGILREAGIEILFERVAIQPGKPTVFGRKDDRFIFGLPGNPVSSFVIFEVMVRPFLLRLMGCSEEPPVLKLPAGTDFSRIRSDRKSMIPVIIRDGEVFPVDYHGSAHINAYSAAEAIMSMPVGIKIIKKGEQVYVRPL